MTEKWKPVSGFEGYYEISDAGRCRRVKPTAKGIPNKVIAPKVTRTGYYNYCLWRNGKPHWKLAHRLAYEAFVDVIPDGLEINHIDGDKANNRVVNLEVVTRSVNSIHRHAVIGHPSANLKITDEQVAAIKASYHNKTANQVQLAREYGVGQSTISRILRGEGRARAS